MPHACQRFWNCYKTLRFCSPLTKCIIPCACHKTTSEHPKVVRTCGVNILTWKCVSRQNAVHFLNVTSSKSAPTLVCFCRFYFEMCFAPQRHTLFRHLNFQKWSEHGALDLEMCFAPGRRAFLRHLNFQKCSEREVFLDVFSFFTCKCASRHNVVQFLISDLPRWLRTRRFSEPTLWPSAATNHWKDTMNRDFSAFSRTCIFFLLTLSLLWSFLFCSSPLWLFRPLAFPSVHIVGSLTSKFL